MKCCLFASVAVRKTSKPRSPYGLKRYRSEAPDDDDEEERSAEEEEDEFWDVPLLRPSVSLLEDEEEELGAEEE